MRVLRIHIKPFKKNANFASHGVIFLNWFGPFTNQNKKNFLKWLNLTNLTIMFQNQINNLDHFIKKCLWDGLDFPQNKFQANQGLQLSGKVIEIK